ncbi:MAG TPA: serine hydrolase, partial [Kofleriaceae bacterium]|nr:serine hydrolase [Kofleriaceae bacterium]
GKRRKKRAARRTPPVPALTAHGLPNVRSASALVVDLDSGTILYGKNPDRVRAIASTGKLFAALVVRQRGLDLEAATEITWDDVDAARGGARTRLDLGESYTNGDLLRVMLVASDNRAVTALGRAVGLSPSGLVAAMNDLARRLGLERTHFTDPTGLNGNVSTAREMAVALRAVLDDPVLAEILATRVISINRVSHKKPRWLHYGNTNRLLHRGEYASLGGKTGYTAEAGYCLVTASVVNGRRLGFVFLGADGELTRFADFSRIWKWMAANRDIQRDGDDTALGQTAAHAQKTGAAR